MSIRPVEYNGMIQNTHDVSTIKQNENNRPMVEQQVLQTEQVKKEQELARKVIKPERREEEEQRYDAKEGGRGGYFGGKRQGRKKQEKGEDRVVVKGQHARFDMKV